jgi:S-adenosylmethionine:tRNA ribosyltransferase-isomerase
VSLRLADLTFERPPELQASAPPELRGRGRDDVRLLVSSPNGHRHLRFGDLGSALRPGDLLVANRSATLPASLPASGPWGAFRLNLSTRYAPALWLAEPRWSHDEPGPLPLAAGDRATVAGIPVHFVAPHAGLERLWFVRFDTPPDAAMATLGEPIRYRYLAESQPLERYQTVFADTPGSAEMPSAGRPFTRALLDGLEARGIGLTTITLHTGVSSLEVEQEDLARLTMYAEPFEVNAEAARHVNATRQRGGRVIGVGTTAVRALESAWDDRSGRLRPARGFTRRFVQPESHRGVVDGLITGLHDPRATHLAMLYAVAGRDLVLEGYREAVARGYLWHEFGDSHLLLR